MRLIGCTLIIVLLVLSGETVFSQVIKPGSFPAPLFTKSIINKTDSGTYILQFIKTICKGNEVNYYFIPIETTVVPEPFAVAALPAERGKFITVHGNISYNFNYRSYIDTPFAENNMMQHAVQARLNVTLKERYPFTVYLTSRRSNSPYFSNATDVSVQFHQSDMLEDVKRKMRADADNILSDRALLLTPAQLYQREKDGVLKNTGGTFSQNINGGMSKIAAAKKEAIQEQLKKLYDEYKTKAAALNVLQQWTGNSSRAQELVEEKEKNIRGNTNDTGNNLPIGDSTEKKIKGAQETIAEKKEQVEKVKSEVAAAEKAVQLYQKKIVDSVQELKKQIAAITDRNTLYDYLQEKGQSINEVPKLQRALLSVKQIGIGRSWIDYSELTVKNISLSGFNIEANPGNIYLAAAAGKVNYRFRDYIVKGSYAGSGQSVGLVRAGFGKKDKNNFIITYYSGKKALLNQASIADSAAVQSISGISVESRFALNENNYLVSEYARSVTPVTPGKMFNFKSHTNEAWSVKLFSHYGNTKFTGYYRKTGEDFQSFTLFPTNNRQDAWMASANQTIWKKRVTLDAAIRKNDFNNPSVLQDLSSTNVFKSFQVTVNIPKYPFLSAGYYPSSQLTLSNNNVLYESHYNTLNIIASHSYMFKKLSMNTNAIYTKFYNSGIDSGFIYYNAATFTLNHSVNLLPFILQGTVTITDQSQLYQTTIEPGITYQLKNKLSLSGSIRRSRINHTQTLWGGTAGLNLYLKKIGVLQLQYDKIHLPGYSRNLLPVDMGRVTFSREF